MRQLFDDTRLAADPALLRYNPMRTYVFLMPGVRWRRFIVSFMILGTPGVIFLVTYEGGTPSPYQLLSLGILAALVSGFFSQILMNKVTLDFEKVIIRKDHHDFTISYSDVDNAFLAGSIIEVDELPLPEGHFPMEFESRRSNIVVLVLRDGTTSKSTAHVRDGILTKYVTFNVAKPQRFLAFLRMRV